MRTLPRLSYLCIFWLMIQALPTTVSAQLCFDIFEDLTDPSLSCADADYLFDRAGGGTDPDRFEGLDTGPFGAEFDGFDLFDPDDPELLPPDNLLEPFFSEVHLDADNSGGQITRFQARHRGSVSMRARDSDFQQVDFGSRSRITFIPFTTDGSTNPVILDLDFDSHFSLRDPADNDTFGVVYGAAGTRVFGEDPEDPLFIFGGLARLDLELSAEPEFFGDFDGSASTQPTGPGIEDEFDVDVEFDTSFEATPGRSLTLDTETFGSIFTDGFESGDTSAWSSSSANTFVVSLGSSNPDVRFMFDLVAEPQPINYGLAGGWFNTATPGQGFLFDFLLDSQFMFVAAFTFDTLSPQEGGNISGAEQRWFTAQGNYSGNRAELTIYQTRNGLFDDPAEVRTEAVGTMVIEFLTCTGAVLHYDLPDLGLSGMIPISKLLADEICTQINEGGIVLEAADNPAPSSSHTTQDVNYGMIGGWFNTATPGQGFLFDFLLDSQFMFVAAFTFDTLSPQEGGNISGAEQRWFTAQGNYSGNRAELTIYQTRNGVFDDPAAVATAAVGTMVIEFLTCTSATITYDLPGFGLSGTVPVSKLLADEICTQINEGGVVPIR